MNNTIAVEMFDDTVTQPGAVDRLRVVELEILETRLTAYQLSSGSRSLKLPTNWPSTSPWSISEVFWYIRE